MNSDTMTNIITITTDFGMEDYFVGVMKGVILSVNPDVRIVDLDNNIDRHDVFRACVSLRNSYKYFPEGTIHLVVVDPGVGSERRPVAVKADGHFFVGPDNGVFSMIYNDSDYFEVYEITNKSCMLGDISTTFHGRDIFAPSAAHLSAGLNMVDIGQPVKDPVKLALSEPVKTEYGFRGKVVYRDTFGNMITNIRSDIVEKNDTVSISGLRILGISESYSDVGLGEPVALVGSSGYLEIAVNMGSASKYFEGKATDVDLLKQRAER